MNTWFDVEVLLNDIAQRIPAGHRLRVAVSTQAWPLVWPAPATMTLELLHGQSGLTLPLLKPEKLAGLKTSQPEAPAIPAPLALTWRRPLKRDREITHDPETGSISRVYLKDDGAYRIDEHGMEVDAWGTLTYRSQGEDPLSVEAEYRYHLEHNRADWNACVECDIRVTADAEHFFLTGEYRALENNQLVRRRQLRVPVRRKFV